LHLSCAVGQVCACTIDTDVATTRIDAAKIAPIKYVLFIPNPSVMLLINNYHGDITININKKMQSNNLVAVHLHNY